VNVVTIETASQMKIEVEKAEINSHALIMAAAVADFQVA
jgi:phosphopantothenoylcysteine synthetase/decarboxylase